MEMKIYTIVYYYLLPMVTAATSVTITIEFDTQGRETTGKKYKIHHQTSFVLIEILKTLIQVKKTFIQAKYYLI